ncbi:MAG TPA: hypothetical protein VM870_05295 [Pyrinomonadaceae bacterium]|nr:hypothetical protein [Pyrinomonadaceae bacterium]
MTLLTRFSLPLAFCALTFAACQPVDNANSNTTATTNVPAPVASPEVQKLSVVERPQKIKDQMSARGEQDSAEPVLQFGEPRAGATISGSTVPVRLDLGGALKGYKPAKDPATGMGNHVHVILDNQPYEAYYDLSQPFELRNVVEGKHTLRVFPSRPWHESYKNAGAFQTVTFTVKGGGDASKPTTTAAGQTMADNKNAANANAAAAPPREGKEMKESQAGEIDGAKPLLTYSRPKGEYKGEDTNAIMIDFWLSNAKLQGDGGDYRVRYSVDNGETQYIDKWAPIWLTGWSNGKHNVKLELVGKDGQVVDNGGYNSTTREITVAK